MSTYMTLGREVTTLHQSTGTVYVLQKEKLIYFLIIKKEIF